MPALGKIPHGQRISDRTAPEKPDESSEVSMRMILVALAAGACLSGCVADSRSQSQPPNYVTSQAHQAPAIRNDAFGGAAMPMRGLPR
jgi:hypothetical protein